MYYTDVALPLPLRQAFTYEVNPEQADFLRAGIRVVVPFGKAKIYTGVVSVYISTNRPILPSPLNLFSMSSPCSLPDSYNSSHG